MMIFGRQLKESQRRKLNAPGFTLVEILTVLFVISMALIGLLALIVQNIQSQSFNKNNLVAYQLAQEGVELVRKVRDTNFTNEVSWDTNLAPGYYYIDYLDNVPHSTTESSADNLLYQDASGFYSHSAGIGSTTIFYRLIKIETLGAADYASYVRSTVSWQDHARDYSYQVETILYDWK